MDIIFHEKIYRDGISQREWKHIQKKVKQKRAKLNLYFITLPLFDNGILEIYWYPELLQKAYKDLQAKMIVVGIAHSREEAYEQIEEIVTDVGWQTGEIPITEYFRERI